MTIPRLAPDEQAQLEKMLARISQEIASHGPLSFARYMEIVLYDPQLGYYMRANEIFGPRGDFVTAPGISKLFGDCVAQQAAEVLSAVGPGAEVLEIGAGDGKMARDMLDALAEQDCLPTRYRILELSGTLRQQQAATLAACPRAVRERVEWIDTLDGEAFNGLVVANEVLDALPVTCVERGDGGWLERCVDFSGGELSWTVRPADAGLVSRLERLSGVEWPVRYRTEICLLFEPWLRTLSKVLERGVVILSDYGDARREYYHPARADGSVRSFYKHRMLDDPLVLPGLADITANVDFTAVAEAAANAGFEVAGFTTQAHFLLGNGLLERVADGEEGSDEARFQQARAIKTLTLPGEMGERFKFLAIDKHYDGRLSGFAHSDQSYRL